MGGQHSGVMNSTQYLYALENRETYSKEAVNYQGILNDFYYKIQSEEKEHVISSECGYAIVTNPFTLKREYFVSSLIKSKYDGIGHRMPSDIVIVLDISGSMGNEMKSRQEDKMDLHSVLDTAKLAIRKLISKLDSNDQLGFVTFDTIARTVFPLSPVNSLNNINELLDPIKPRGGTCLYIGLKQGVDEMRAKMRKNAAHRIFYLTDMGNNSEGNFNELFQSITLEEEPIFTSIIGLGCKLHSSFLTICSNNKGSSSFSAMTEEDLEDIIVNNYDYNFFPVAHDIKMNFRSGNFIVNKVYGTSDSKAVKSKEEEKLKVSHVNKMTSEMKKSTYYLLLYFNRIKKRLPLPVLRAVSEYNRYTNETVLDIKSVFSSPIIKDTDKILMKGGMTLLRLTPQKYCMDSFAEIVLEGYDLDGYAIQNINFIDIKNDNARNDYYSNEEIKEGIILYYYAKFLRSFAKYSNSNITYEQKEEHYLEVASWKERAINCFNSLGNEKKKEEMMIMVEKAIKAFKPVKPGVQPNSVTS